MKKERRTKSYRVFHVFVTFFVTELWNRWFSTVSSCLRSTSSCRWTAAGWTQRREDSNKKLCRFLGILFIFQVWLLCWIQCLIYGCSWVMRSKQCATSRVLSDPIDGIIIICRIRSVSYVPATVFFIMQGHSIAKYFSSCIPTKLPNCE